MPNPNPHEKGWFGLKGVGIIFGRSWPVLGNIVGEGGRGMGLVKGILGLDLGIMFEAREL